MTDPNRPNPNPSSQHFLLYRGENAFGQTLSLDYGRYPELLLHQPFNEWSQKCWAEGGHQERNEDHLLRMLEKAYAQGRESMRLEFVKLLEPPVGKH